MQLLNRFVAAFVTLLLLAVVISFGLGHYMTELERLFSFSGLSLIVQFLVAIALLIIVFFGRPRSSLHRAYFGSVATLAICFGAYGAFTGTLLLGEALIVIIGAIITVAEAVEGDLVRRPAPQASDRLPTKAKPQV